MITLGALPETEFTLEKGNLYTLYVATVGVLGKPSETTVKEAIHKRLGILIEVISVRNPLFSREYVIVFKFLRLSMSLSKLIPMVIDVFKFDMGYDASPIDFKTGAVVEVSSPLSIPSLSDTISSLKWVGIAVAAVMIMPYVGPVIKYVLTKGEK